MDIGTEERTVTYEPIEDPFRKDDPAPREEPVEVPDPEREDDREKVPA